MIRETLHIIASLIISLSGGSQNETLKSTPCIFPGACENSGLKKEEQISCTESKLIWFLPDTIEYPASVINSNCKAKIIISFVINEKGQVEDKYIIKGACEELDQAVLKSLDMLPRFKPAMMNGVPQKTLYTFPIQIHLK